MKSKTTLTFFQLSLMLFLQYMLFAVWWVPLAAYLTNIGVEGFQKSLILSSMAIGCLASPLVGTIADRYFPGKRVLMVSNMLTAVLLFFAARQTDPGVLFVLLLLAMIVYMPTWGLTSAIAMEHADPDQFPRIRVFGTIGWVVSAVFSLVAVRYYNVTFDGTNIPFYCGSAVALLAAVSNLGLPKSVKGRSQQKLSVMDVLGLRSVSMMKDKNYAVFIVISFLAMIPFALYFSFLSQFLQDVGFQYITLTMNLGQFAEMFFMVLVPFMLKRYGIRTTMILGLLALLIRYVAFYIGGTGDLQSFYFIAILVHGIIFGFFFVGGQVYIRKKAPEELNAQAQGLIFLVTFGLGLLVGNFISGELITMFTGTIGGEMVVDWNRVWGITVIITLVIFILFLLFFRNDVAEKKER